jgi:hypothetical protein
MSIESELQSELQETERKTYLAYFNDGISDLFAGLVVLSFGLGMLFGEATLFIFAWMPFILIWPFKRAVTYPRMGYVKFTPQRRRKLKRNWILLFVAGVFTLLLGVVSTLAFEGVVFNLREFMLQYGDLIVGVVMAIPFFLIGVLFEVGRFFGYSLLIIGGWALPYLVEVQSGLPVALSGGAIAFIGVGLLISFLSRYPLPSE